MLTNNNFITAGIDVGSVATKVVILKNGKIVGKSLTLTKADPFHAATFALKKALKEARLHKNNINFIVATGYGRRAIEFANETVTEIICNAKAANFLGSPFGKIGTIIDLGGQDSKAILLDNDGKVERFVMNDKCSAGTGRFLEVMARTLELKLDEFGKLSLKSKNPIKINSTCTIFAETEIISLIAQKKKVEDMIAGLHFSIAEKLVNLASQIGIKDVIFFDGGGAKNVGIKVALEKMLGKKVYVPPFPEYVVALGAALIGVEKC